jgi:hypothetical protein
MGPAESRTTTSDCEIALTRKNALLAGHEDGTENWAILASLIETAKLSNIDPKPGLPISSAAWLMSGPTIALTSFCLELGPLRASNNSPPVESLSRFAHQRVRQDRTKTVLKERLQLRIIRRAEINEWRV